MKNKILIIDDEENIRFSFKAFLEREGYEALLAENYGAAIEILTKTKVDIIVSDINLTGYTGIDLLKEIRNTGLNTPVVLITAAPEIKTAAESVRLGAFDYVLKPVDLQDFLRIVKQALRYKMLAEEKDAYRCNLEAIFRSIQEGIITVDTEMNVLKINQVAEKFMHSHSGDIKNKKLSECILSAQGECCEVLDKTLATRKRILGHRVEWPNTGVGNQVVILETSPLFSPDGTVIGAILVIRDITRLTDLERTLEDRHKFHRLIGKNNKMQEIYSLIETIGPTDATVLLTGETGTGKELVAEALHHSSSRALKPFVKVNCSALAETLLESELFGHVKGAFTGAIKDKIGRFQLADGGTILLDEIGDISPAVQLKLLRVLQEREFERVGDHVSVKVDVRVVAATNRNLAARVQNGDFRQDLYYRIKVMDIMMPPLRERKDDIPLLANHFCALFNKSMSKNISSISDEVLGIFMNYDWPGNIRELKHALEHAFVLCQDEEIMPANLPRELQNIHIQIADIVVSATQDDILKVLGQTKWNIAKAARTLGISRPTMYKKMKEFKPDAEQ